METRQGPRTLRIDAGRLLRWVDGFAARHGDLGAGSRPDGVVVLTAADGSTALLHPVFPRSPRPADDDGVRAAVRDVVDAALEPRTVAVLLVRAGGYACAVIAGGAITASKVGSRHVQGRTAAGGWSQQRFARRRENQRGSLVGSAADTAVAVLLPVRNPDALVTGGERTLVGRVLADPRLAAVAALPRGPHLEVGTPRAAVVRELPGRLRAVRVDLTETAPPG